MDLILQYSCDVDRMVLDLPQECGDSSPRGKLRVVSPGGNRLVTHALLTSCREVVIEKGVQAVCKWLDPSSSL